MALCPRGAKENLGPDSLASEITGCHFTDFCEHKTESFNYGPSVREENWKAGLFVFFLAFGQNGWSAT